MKFHRGAHVSKFQTYWAHFVSDSICFPLSEQVTSCLKLLTKNKQEKEIKPKRSRREFYSVTKDQDDDHDDLDTELGDILNGGGIDGENFQKLTSETYL